jgi:hypothetical protein
MHSVIAIVHCPSKLECTPDDHSDFHSASSGTRQEVSRNTTKHPTTSYCALYIQSHLTLFSQDRTHLRRLQATAISTLYISRGKRQTECRNPTKGHHLLLHYISKAISRPILSTFPCQTRTSMLPLFTELNTYSHNSGNPK